MPLLLVVPELVPLLEPELVLLLEPVLPPLAPCPELVAPDVLVIVPLPPLLVSPPALPELLVGTGSAVAAQATKVIKPKARRSARF
jgi:hypothetical protein